MVDGDVDPLPGAEGGAGSAGPVAEFCDPQVTATIPIRTAIIANPTSASPAVCLRLRGPVPFGVPMPLSRGEGRLATNLGPPATGPQPVHPL
jgi:hypothetical protein